MYTPAEAKPSEIPNIRIGIQGEPGSGKTTAALTFPNVTVLNFDNKLPQGTLAVPFWNDDFVWTLVPKKGNLPANTRDAFLEWLKKNYAKFEPGQTVVLDSWTMLQKAFDQQSRLEPSFSKSGQEDKFAFWKHKLEYSCDVCSLLQKMRCMVVVTVHDQRERDSEGNLTGKFKPLQQGAFADMMAGFFTCWFGQHSRDEKRKEYPSEYLWQIRSDSLRYSNIDIVIPPELKFIKAGYQHYMELRGKYPVKVETP